MNEYFKHNPIAKQLFEGYYEKLFENEQVDSILNKVVDNALNTFKILVFDLAPKRDRNPNVLRTKLSDILNSKTVKTLTAKLVDYAESNDLSDSKFAEAKRLYLEALKKFADALNRSSEISKAKDDIIFKQFKNNVTKLQNSIDVIAKNITIEDEEKNESVNIDAEEMLNESIFTGYKSRILNLRRLLTNLISSSEGKDQKSGYGRDWKRTFLDLDEKRKALDKSEGGEKNKKVLEELEKQIEKFQEEFNNAMIQTANRTLQQLEADEEVATTYSDVTELVNQALDLMTRAKTQYGLAIIEIKDAYQNKEIEMSKTVFPISRGDKDTDKKFKNSDLIFAIQTALCNGMPAADKLIKSKGGPNGKYGPATASVIAAIQKIMGNKNTNGAIDQSLLFDILASDWVSKDDKKAINAALSKIGAKMNENKKVLSLAEYKSLNEGKIIINQAEIEKEIPIQYKEILADQPEPKDEDVNNVTASNINSAVNSLSKKLRQKYNIKVESEDFVKNDQTLKASYSIDFIKYWNDALDKAEPAEDYSYFFANNGLYNINTSTSSLKNACNWTKWLEARQLKTLDNEDAIEFLNNYLKGWNTFGMIKPSARYDGIKLLLKRNSDEELELSGAFEMMNDTIKNKEVPFIEFEELKNDISKAFNIILQSGEKNPDLGKDDFVALNNFLIMVANAVSFDGNNFISCIKWLNDNIISENTAKRIVKDSIPGVGEDESNIGQLLTYQGNTITVGEYADIKGIKIKSDKDKSEDLFGISILADMKNTEDNDRGIKGILGSNCYYISADIYPSIIAHLKRINCVEFGTLPQKPPFKVIDVTIK